MRRGIRMAYESEIHRRRSTRLQDWDYSWPWWYYVTIVVKSRQCRFGHIEDDRVALSDLGKIAEDCWRQIPQHHGGIDLDDYVVMPNHIHGIVILNGSGEGRRDVQLNVPTDGGTLTECPYTSRREAMGALSPKRGSLSVVIRTFKAAVTAHVRNAGIADFGWQERFHDHIIRNDADLRRIRTYISNNPLQWAIDEENPQRRKEVNW